MNDKHMTTARAAIALGFGQVAFQKGKPRIPAQDKNIMGMIAPGTPIGASDTIVILTAWLQGWDTENLKGDTP